MLNKVGLISRAKRVFGDGLFHCQNGLGQYRLKKVRHRKPLAVLMYHGLETDPRRCSSNSHWVTPEGCLKEIRFFQRQGYQLVSAQEIDDLASRKEENCAGYLLVSFDDGHANIFPHVKKWLAVERIPVLLGICPGIVEENAIYWWEEVRTRFQCMHQDSLQIMSRDGGVHSFRKEHVQEFEESGRDVPHHELQFRLEQLRQQTSYVAQEQLRASVHVHENMNWEQISELAKHPLCTLASHSMHHEIATQVSADELRLLTRTSLELLEARAGSSVRHYIYPNGRLSEETDRVLAGLGIAHTYSVTSVLNVIPPTVRLNRFKGADFGNVSLWNYGRRWHRRHGQLTAVAPYLDSENLKVDAL